MYRELKQMYIGEELTKRLISLPEYDPNIKNEDVATRLMELSKLYQIYIPSEMSIEIYNKLYMAILRSLKKKGTKEAVMQSYENAMMVKNNVSRGIIGGSDSFTIIGTSGIGKSSAIMRAMEVITDGKLIHTEGFDIIPAMIVQCPHDCSVKALLLEVLRKIDGYVDTSYYTQSVRARATTDMLIGTVSQALLNHVGLLVVDEIQNVVDSRYGKALVSMLTQLINNSGISICMVGTPICEIFFEKEIQLARRALGLKYRSCEYNDYFRSFVELIFSYQFTNKATELSETLCRWLYDHSGGILSLVVSLMYDVQELAILSGEEIISVPLLEKVYRERYHMMASYVNLSDKRPSQTSETKPAKEIKAMETQEIIEKNRNTQDFKLDEILMSAKKMKTDAVMAIKDYVNVVEVAV